MNLWDVRLNAGASALLSVPEGHTAQVFVRKGRVIVNGKTAAHDAELVVLDRKGEGIRIDAENDAQLVILSGQPIDEPVAGYGPFVMNTNEEIRQAITDYQSGRMGRLAEA
jgi:redox-sensitive bicupin YhaK (pirin superfamily)